MKVLQICTEFLPSIGGIQLNIYNLAKRLIERGHEVSVLTTNVVGGGPAKLPSEESNNSIRVLRLSVLPTRISSRLALAPSVVPSLFSLDADVFHVFSILPYFLTNSSCIITRLRRKPLIITPVYHPIRYSVYTGLATHLRKVIYDEFFALRLLKNADCVIALTEREAQYYRRLGVKSIRVIPVGVDINQGYDPREIHKLKKRFGLHGRVIVHVGRLEKRKGVQFAMRAMPHILENFSDAKLLLVGSGGGYMDVLKNLARKLGIEDSVVFAGRLLSCELSAAYELADIVVVPSIFETFSHVAIEAFAHEKPLIASRTIGFAERITSSNGILIDPGDYEALATAAVRLLSDDHLVKCMGRNGRQIVEEEFTWDKAADKLEKIYASAYRS